MMIRRFKEKDAQAVSDLIAVTLRRTNRKDYSVRSLIESPRKQFSPNKQSVD